MPAIARGLVSSRTLCPASRLFATTEKTTYLSPATFARSRSFPCSLLMRFIAGMKNFSASDTVQMTVHSIGVTEMLRKGCWLDHGILSSILVPIGPARFSTAEP